MSMPISLELTTPVADDRPVFVSGNFSNWVPASESLQMQRTGPTTYQYRFPEGFSWPEPIEYKYNRGGWDHVELDFTGEGTINRTFRVDEPHPQGLWVQDTVPHWRWFGQPFNPEFMPKVELLSEAFEVPQLDTTRRIHVLLPYDYYETGRHYPVLYLHDGQNLFGEGTGFGSWNVDQKMAMLAARRHHEMIIVSIDHGQEERIKEFSLYRTRFGQAKGRQYLKFITETLKPHIDATYRTISDHEHTGIGGSSMGGLISIYGGLMHPDVFGRLLIFSPSLWISPKIYFDAIHFRKSMNTRVYIYGGGAESAYMVPNLQRLQQACLRQGCDEMTLQIEMSVDPGGEHHEARWGREFPRAVEWLFFSMS